MKKYIIYIGILAAGLLLGWLFFGNSSNKEIAHNHETITETNQMWTCSMHPQIRQNQPGACPICGMELIPLESSSISPLVLEMTEEAVQLAHIQTTIVGSENRLTSSLFVSGKVEADETTSGPASFVVIDPDGNTILIDQHI